MEHSSLPDTSQKSTFTTSERIAELNDIDQSISTLLSAASDAIGILSNSPTSDVQETALRTPSSARSAFTSAASTYFSTLSSIEVRLRRQVYALEEAGLIHQGDERDAMRGRAIGGENNIARGGGGPLDTSWLNARANDIVGEGMKQELLHQALDFVERVKGDIQNTKKEPMEDVRHVVKSEQTDADMDVDAMEA